MIIEATFHLRVVEDDLVSFRKRFPGASIHSINGREVLGFCEQCTAPIYEDTKVTRYLDDILVHTGKCPGVKAVKSKTVDTGVAAAVERTDGKEGAK